VVLYRLNSAATLIQRTTTEAPDDEYELYRIGLAQEDYQLLREGREWSRATGRPGWIGNLPLCARTANDGSGKVCP
jgi:hypothetical protein